MNASSPRTRAKSRGQSMVELALILPAFVAIVFGTIELGRLIWVNHEVANGTREGARWAMVHGSESGACADSAGATAAALDHMAGVNSDSFSVAVEFPDGTCDPGSKVLVSSSYVYDPIFALIIGSGSLTLEHTSEVIIQH